MLKITGIKQKTDNICLLLLFIAVLGYMPTSREGDSIVWLVCVLLFIANTIIKGKPLRFNSAIAWYSLIVFYGFFSCLWATYTARFFSFFTLTFLVVTVSIICLGGYMNTDEDVDKILCIIIIAACIAGLRYCYYTDWSTILSGYYMRGTFAGLIDDTTNYNNYTSPLCIVAVIAAFYCFVRKKKTMYIPFALLTAILIFSGSRKTYLTLLAVVIFFALTQGNVKSKIKSIIAVVIILVIAIYALNNIEALSQIKERTFSLVFAMFGEGELDNSSSLRQMMREGAKEVWLSHPILGVGWENYRYYNPVSEATAHNCYLEILASLGVIGFILYYSYLAFLIVQTIVKLLKKGKNSWDLLLLGILFTLLILDYGGVSLYSRGQMFIVLTIFSVYSTLNNRTRSIKWR